VAAWQGAKLQRVNVGCGSSAVAKAVKAVGRSSARSGGGMRKKKETVQWWWWWGVSEPDGIGSDGETKVMAQCCGMRKRETITIHNNY
jgi:hypothetical protein